MRFDQDTAQCWLFTFKEGLLSPIAHDLKISVGKFAIELTATGISAEFAADSLRVDCAMHGTNELPNKLSAQDKRTIEENVRREVLTIDRYPTIRFRSPSVISASTVCPTRLDGTLSLCGREQPLSLRVYEQGGAHIGEATVHQPSFGIRPYSAMLGTLKVKSDVQVRIVIPSTR